MRDVDRAIGVMDDNISRLTAEMESMNEQDSRIGASVSGTMKQMQSLFQSSDYEL